MTRRSIAHLVCVALVIATMVWLGLPREVGDKDMPGPASRADGKAGSPLQSNVGEPLGGTAESTERSLQLVNKLLSALAAQVDESRGSFSVDEYCKSLATLQSQLEGLRRHPSHFLLAVDQLEKVLVDESRSSVGLRALIALMLGINHVPSSVALLKQRLVSGESHSRIPALLGLSLSTRSRLARRRATNWEYWRAAVESLGSDEYYALPGVDTVTSVKASGIGSSLRSVRIQVFDEIQEFQETLGRIRTSSIETQFSDLLEKWPEGQRWILVARLSIVDIREAANVADLALTSHDLRLSNRAIESLSKARGISVDPQLQALCRNLQHGNGRAYALSCFLERFTELEAARRFVRDTVLIDQHPDVTAVSIQWLADDPSGKSWDAIYNLASKGPSQKQISALRAMRRVGIDVHVERKLALCAELVAAADPALRVEALTTAEVLSPAGAVKLARQLCDDPNVKVSQSAKALLGRHR